MTTKYRRTVLTTFIQGGSEEGAYYVYQVCLASPILIVFRTRPSKSTTFVARFW